VLRDYCTWDADYHVIVADIRRQFVHLVDVSSASKCIHQSPIITSFLSTPDRRFEFSDFYAMMKARRFVLYPGRVSDASTFRIGTIGHVFPADIRLPIDAVRDVVAHLGITQWA
jgi:aspartate aminotransferase-like enzyme